MVGELVSLVSSLKSLKDIAETMIGLRDDAAFQAKTIEFQSKIVDSMDRAIAAQEERATLLQKVGELEEEVARLKAWETEKQRYELKALGLGTLAYAVKEAVRGTEPPHWICQRCYEDGRKAILQPETRFPGRTKVYVCHRCRSELIAEGGREAALNAPRPTVQRRPPR